MITSYKYAYINFDPCQSLTWLKIFRTIFAADMKLKTMKQPKEWKFTFELKQKLIKSTFLSIWELFLYLF